MHNRSMKCIGSYLSVYTNSRSMFSPAGFSVGLFAILVHVTDLNQSTSLHVRPCQNDGVFPVTLPALQTPDLNLVLPLKKLTPSPCTPTVCGEYLYST